MTFLRHASRAVHQSMVGYMTQQLTALDWIGPSSEVPFGAAPVKIQPVPAFIGNNIDPAIVVPSTVAINLGHEPKPVMGEVGGPLAYQDFPFFFDVFSDKAAICTALANDIRDILMGRFAGQTRFLTITDPISQTVRTDWSVELMDIELVRPEHTFPLAWISVHATAMANFSETTF